MSDITNDFVNKLYSENGKQLTPEKLEYIKSNYSTKEEFEKVFLKTVSLSTESRVAEVEKKNLDSTAMSEEAPLESPIQEPKKNTLSVGGKPLQAGDSASSAGKGKSVFGESVSTFQEDLVANKNAKDKEKEKKKPQENKQKASDVKEGDDLFYRMYGDTKTIYVNRDPKRGQVDEIPKNLPEGYTYTVVKNSIQLKKWKEQQLKKVEIEKENTFGTSIQSPIDEIVQSNIKASKDAKITSKIPVSTNQVVNNAYDYAVKNLDTSITEQKYEDEVNESQFMDGVKNGLINLYNTKIGIPASSITNKNLIIKKSKPLEDQYEEIAKIEKKEGVSYSPEKKAKMAKEMFIEQENKNQIYTLIDKALPSGYDREGIWKDLKLQSIRSNDQLRSTIASAEVFKGKITQFNDFFKDISTSTRKGLKGPGVDTLEETQEGYVFEYDGQKITLSPKQYQEFEKLKADAIDAQAKLKSMASDIDRIYKKAKKDDELIDLFKYNYNDFDATIDQVLGGFGEIIGGSLKQLGESSNYIKQKIGFAPGLALIPGVSDSAIKTGNALLDVSEETTSQYLRYNISDLSWKNLPSFGRQLFSEQLPILLTIAAGGSYGMAAVSAGGGGRLFIDLEKQEKLPFGRKYSLGEKLTAAWLYAGAEYGGEYFGTGLLLRGFRNTIRNASLPARKLYFEGLIDAGKKFAGKTATGSFIEGSSEGATGAIQIGVDLGVLGKDVKSKEVFERMYESIGTGGFMGFGMASVGSNIQFMVSQAKVFATREENRKISKILTDIEALSQELNNNPLLSDDDKAIIKSDIETKADEAYEIITKNANKDKDFSISEKAELLSISASQIDLREQYEAINKSNINSDLKKQKISDLNKKFDGLEKKRAEIIKGTFEPFNYLPEEEKTALKVEAATILKQDALDSGTKEEDINIPSDLIEKKAKGLHNQKIQQKNEKGTGQTNTEEKPTGINAEQTTSATQQKDGVQLQPQEEVDNLRKAEVNELKDNVENPEQFITNGKVDGKKVSESDNAKAKEIYAKYDKLIKPLLNNIKTQEDAIQKQSTNEGVLQPKQPQVGLQEVEQGDQVDKKPTEQGEEKIDVDIFSEVEGKDLTDKTTYDKVYDFLTKVENDLSDIQDNTLTAQGLPIAVVKAAIKAMKLAMEAGKTASEVLKSGMDSLKNSDWYSKKSDVEKSNLEPIIGNLLVESSIREEGRMIAKSKAREALKSLFKMVGKANKNVLAGKAGKLTGIASKILGLTSLNPKSVRKVVDDSLYSQYVSAISRLSGRNLTIEDTNIKRYDAVYDKIVKAYEEFERKKSEIQNKIDAGVALDDSEKEFYNKNKSDFSQKDTNTIDKSKDNEEKREEVIDEILNLKPLLAQAFKGTSAPKGSKTFDYLKAVSEIKKSDLESMSDSMLNNTLNALNSIANDGVSVSYLEKIYSHIMSEDVANAAKKASKVAGKTGLYKYKLPRFFLNTAERLSSLVTKGVTQKKDIILKRIFEFRGNRIDDAVKNYGESYLYNSIMSILAKNLSAYSAVNERALEKIKNAEKELIKSLGLKDSVSESFFKISFYLIDSMAKSNHGTTSSVDAIKYFIETAKLESTNYSEDVIDKLQKFINKIEGGELIDEFGNVKLTEAEKNAANVISDVLIDNQDRAYEGRFFQNANSSPLIINYHPVTNNSSTSIKDVMEVINAFLTTSTISGNLMEKTGTAHPINVNPFSNAMSSIMNTNLQYFLRTEVMAISKGIDKAISEATDVNEKRYLIGIRDGVKAFIDEVIAGNSVISSKLDNVLDSLKSITNRVLLSNEIRAVAEFATNSPVLFVDGAEMLIEGRKLVGKLKELSKDNDEIIFNFLTNVEASQIPRLLEKIKSTSERAEYSRKGVGTEYLSKTIPMSTANAKFDNFVKNNNLVDGVKEYNNFVMSGSDNFSAFTYWFGKFNDEFKKIYGEAIDVDGASDSNSDYLKDKNVLDAIKRASNVANDQTTELFGSTNKFEKQLDIMASSATGKAKNALLNIAKETVNFMNQFQMGVVEAMRSNVNRGVENKDAREARKFVLQGVRTTGYTITALAIITELLSYLIPEDDDEKKLKDSLGNLRDDEELIKEVNKYMSIMDPKKEDEDVELSEEDALFKEQFLDKMMKNEDFVNAYKSYIGFMNRDILQRTIEAAADAINNKVIRFEKDSFDNVMKSINDGDTELLSKNDLVYSLGFLNSEQGRSAFNSEKRNELFNKIEEVIDEKEVFYSLDSREKMNYLDVQAMHNTVALLYNHRKMDLNDMYLKEGAKAGLDFAIGRKNNLVRAAVHYGAEQINKARIEAKYGAYDYKKDAVFRPITSYKIDDNLKDKSFIKTVFKDLGKAILPAYVNLPNTISGSDMSIAKFAGIPLTNSLDRLYRKNKQDELKLETVSKFQKNYLIESNESKEAVEFAFNFFGLKNEEKDETIQTSIVPGKQGDKGNVEKKSKRSGIGGGKDLKVNGRKTE